jgi:threonine dehydratase
MLSQNDVVKSYQRIKKHLHKTPILSSETLNEMLGHEIYFKIESLQKTGAFKVRGALNHLLILQERKKLPKKIVGYSTGNHGIGLAWSARLLRIHARIYLPQDTANVKKQAAEYYGAEVIYTSTRIEAEMRALEDAKKGYYYLHPSDSDETILGVSTLCYEALNQLDTKPDAIFASCGGGGLLSGTYLAKEILSPESKLFGTEPLNADDAYRSIKSGKIESFSDAPSTIADGLKTLKVSERTFHYLKLLDDMYLCHENEIFYWTAWLIHLLKVACEPSCAMNMIGTCKWLSKQKNKKSVLVIISGGNIDPVLYRQLWKEDYLLTKPRL